MPCRPPRELSRYLLIDFDGGNGPLSLVANQQKRVFRELRHCDWLSPKVEHFRRRGRLVDIVHQLTSYKRNDLDVIEDVSELFA